VKLYYMPGACSLAVHIALREAACDFELLEVDYATRRLAKGGDFRAINPKGYVPALLVEDGWLLTEVPVILQVLDGQVPEAGLLPQNRTRRRFEALEWLNFIATEVHKSFSPLFRQSTPNAFREPGMRHLVVRLTILEAHLAGHRFLMGDLFTAGDAYLFTVCRWLEDLEVPLRSWPARYRHAGEIQQRPAVRAALAAEGLMTIS
jgi:glutathione S-transferase